MKGPGVRSDIDTRRAWRCPACGAMQRLPLDVTSVRCACSRESPLLKLMENKRPERRSLRTEVRTMIDRILAGEEFARMTSLTSSGSEGHHGEPGFGSGDSRPPRRPPRHDYSSGAPRGPRPPARVSDGVESQPAPQSLPPAMPMPAAEPPAVLDDDAFGAGLSSAD